MERAAEPHLLRASRDLVRAVREALPLLLGEVRIGRAHAAGDPPALGVARLREHEDGRAEIREKPRGLHGVGELLLVPGGVVQSHRTERAGEREAALAQLTFKRRGTLR